MPIDSGQAREILRDMHEHKVPIRITDQTEQTLTLPADVREVGIRPLSDIGTGAEDLRPIVLWASLVTGEVAVQDGSPVRSGETFWFRNIDGRTTLYYATEHDDIEVVFIIRSK